MKTFRFTIDNGALSITREAQGRDWQAAWVALGYPVSAAAYKVISYEIVAA